VERDRQPVFYFDLASPYACLSAFRLNAVLPVAPVWQPVWMGPILAAAGRDWRRSAAEVRERHADIERRAAGYGMPPWCWPQKYRASRELGVDAEPVNTLDVMRLVTFADGAGVGEEFARRAFHLAFGEGRDVTTVGDEVITAAVACGLDAKDARAARDDPEIKLALRDATDAASARGVTGMPTVAVRDELFSGDDRLEDAAAAVAAIA
jgi:2-hydroxychromene-2-carboxylate isomerase